MHTHTKRLYTFFFLFICIFLNYIQTLAMETPVKSEEHIFDMIYRLRLPALTQQGPMGALSWPDRNPGKEMTISEQIEDYMDYQLNPGIAESFKKACTILKFSDYWNDQSDRMQLDLDTINDLNILTGSHDNLDACLASKVNNTKTTLGSATLCAQLISPYKNIDALQKRSACIHSLTCLSTLQQLSSALRQASEYEDDFMSFSYYDANDMFAYALGEPALLRKAEGLADSIKKKINTMGNQNEWISTAKEVIPLVMPLVDVAIDLYSGNSWLIKLKNLLISDKKMQVESYHQLLKEAGYESPAKLSPAGIFHCFVKIITPAPISRALGHALAIESAISDIKNMYTSSRENLLFIQAAQKKLIRFKKFVDALKQAQAILKTTDDPHVKTICENLQFSKTEHSEKLLSLLGTSTFEGTESMLSNWGRVKVAHLCLRQCTREKEFLPLAAALGELDFLVACAELKLHSSILTNSLCIPEFKAQSYEPFLHAINYWNPTFDPKKAVSNEIQFGVDLHRRKPLTAIISGENGTGKTSNTTNGLTKGVLLSQSLCLAPGTTFCLTPFDSISTFFKTETDENNGCSLFGNVLTRSKKIIDIAQNNPGFKFIALDEPCSGATKEKLSQSVAYNLIKMVGRAPHVVCIATTHLPEPTRLEEEHPTYFANYRSTKEFKIVPGIGSFESEYAGIEMIRKILGQNFECEVKKRLPLSPAAAAAADVLLHELSSLPKPNSQSADTQPKQCLGSRVEETSKYRAQLHALSEKMCELLSIFPSNGNAFILDVSKTRSQCDETLKQIEKLIKEINSLDELQNISLTDNEQRLWITEQRIRLEKVSSIVSMIDNTLKTYKITTYIWDHNDKALDECYEKMNFCAQQLCRIRKFFHCIHTGQVFHKMESSHNSECGKITIDSHEICFDNNAHAASSLLYALRPYSWENCKPEWTQSQPFCAII